MLLEASKNKVVKLSDVTVVIDDYFAAPKQEQNHIVDQSQLIQQQLIDIGLAFNKNKKVEIKDQLKDVMAVQNADLINNEMQASLVQN